MALALFDLDHTLLNADSDQLWGDLLREQGLVDDRYQQDKDRYFADYQRGELDIRAFVRYLLTPLKGRSETELAPLLADYLQRKIRPNLRAHGLRCWQKHRERRDHCVIVTATNRLLAGVSAQMLQADALVATEPELIDGRVSGEIAGVPAFREGKVTRMLAYCQHHHHDLADAHFYSDSHNDLPLLQAVAHAYAVTPDPRLRAHAEQAGWLILDWQQ